MKETNSYQHGEIGFAFNLLFATLVLLFCKPVCATVVPEDAQDNNGAN